MFQGLNRYLDNDPGSRELIQIRDITTRDCTSRRVFSVFNPFTVSVLFFVICSSLHPPSISFSASNFVYVGFFFIPSKVEIFSCTGEWRQRGLS